MSKRNIIFICIAVAVIIVVAFAVYFIVKAVNKSEKPDEGKIVIEKYGENSNIEKRIEITKKKKIKEFTDKYSNPSLEQDDKSQYLAIKNDVKLDFGNGKYIMMQLDLPEYCYYEDPNSETKLVIKMPEGLLEEINNILEKN